MPECCMLPLTVRPATPMGIISIGPFDSVAFDEIRQLSSLRWKLLRRLFRQIICFGDHFSARLFFQFFSGAPRDGTALYRGLLILIKSLASHRLKGSALGLGMDWIMRKIPSVFAQFIRLLLRSLAIISRGYKLYPSRNSVPNPVRSCRGCHCLQAGAITCPVP